MNKCRQKILDMLEEVKNDVMKVFDFGAQKHPDSGETPNFLTKDGNKCSIKDRGSSMLRHHAKAYDNPGAVDDESGLEHLLHGMACDSILYIRHKRGIVHSDDEAVHNSQTESPKLCAPSPWVYAGENLEKDDD